MNYQQKKADSVGVGLLKEGDNAQFHYFALPADPNRLTFVNRLFGVPIYIDAKEPKKLQNFPKFSEDSGKTSAPKQKRPADGG